MTKLPGVSHQRAIRAFEKAGFRIIKEVKHISMFNGKRIIVIPRANPIDAFTMAGIIKDADLTVAQFKKLLR